MLAEAYAQRRAILPNTAAWQHLEQPTCVTPQGRMQPCLIQVAIIYMHCLFGFHIWAPLTVRLIWHYGEKHVASAAVYLWDATGPHAAKCHSCCRYIHDLSAVDPIWAPSTMKLRRHHLNSGKPQHMPKLLTRSVESMCVDMYMWIAYMWI